MSHQPETTFYCISLGRYLGHIHNSSLYTWFCLNIMMILFYLSCHNVYNIVWQICTWSLIFNIPKCYYLRYRSMFVQDILQKKHINQLISNVFIFLMYWSEKTLHCKDIANVYKIWFASVTCWIVNTTAFSLLTKEVKQNNHYAVFLINLTAF